MSRRIAYLVSDELPEQAWNTLLGHMTALKRGGHQIVVYYLRGDDRPLALPDFPAFEFAYSDYENLARMARSDSSLKVATDWRTAHMVADICPEQCVYLLLEDEFGRADNLYEARATRSSFRLGVPMAAVSDRLAAEVEAIGGVRPRVVPLGTDNETPSPGIDSAPTDEPDSERVAARDIQSAPHYDWDAHVARFIEILHEVSGEDVSAGAGVPSVSIVIPTKNGGTDFFFLMRKIQQAADHFDIETVVVDSGSTDATVETARQHGAVVIEIPAEEFNHGTTRNVGADASTGEYILFFTQDAIPIGNDWLSRMIQPLIDDPKLAAVRGREIPRSDADLFCGWMDWNYHGGYSVKDDQLIDLGGIDFHSLQPGQKRHAAQLADTVTCVRADVFRRFRFHDVNFAEDLDLGIRLLEHGYRLRFLFHGGVVHSHNREAFYIMRRFYVDSKLIPGVLGFQPPATPFNGAAALGSARRLYSSVQLAATRVANEPADLALVRDAARMNGVPGNGVGGDAMLDAFFAGLPETPEPQGQDLLGKGFANLLDRFADYFERVYGSYETLEPQMGDCLYKLFAASVGMQLGGLAAAHPSTADKIVRQLDSTLSAGV